MRKARLIPLLLPLALWAISPAVTAGDKDQGDKANKERRIEQKRQHYKSLPEKKQQELRNARKKYKDLSPDQQRKLRERYKKQKQKK